jgi:hypothetical protein
MKYFVFIQQFVAFTYAEKICTIPFRYMPILPATRTIANSASCKLLAETIIWNIEKQLVKSCLDSYPGKLVYVHPEGTAYAFAAKDIVAPPPSATTGAVFFSDPSTCDNLQDHFAGNTSSTSSTEVTDTFQLSEDKLFEDMSLYDMLIQKPPFQRLSITHQEARQKLFNKNYWDKRPPAVPEKYSLLDLFGDKKFLFLEFGAEWCMSCKAVTSGLPGVPYNVVKNDLYPILKQYASVVDVLDNLHFNTGVWGGKMSQLEGGEVVPAMRTSPDSLDYALNVDFGTYLKPLSPSSSANIYLESTPSAFIMKHKYQTSNPYVSPANAILADPLVSLFGTYNEMTGYSILEKTDTSVRIITNMGHTLLLDGNNFYGGYQDTEDGGDMRIRRLAAAIQAPHLVSQLPAVPTTPPMTQSGRCKTVESISCTWCNDDPYPTECKQSYATWYDRYNCCTE